MAAVASVTQGAISWQQETETLVPRQGKGLRFGGDYMEK